MGSGNPKPVKPQNQSYRASSDAILEKLKVLEGKDLDISDTIALLLWIDSVEKDLRTDHQNTEEFEGIGQSKPIFVDIKQLGEEKNRLLNIISEIAGARLKNNNPGITDLSDKNRSNKIAERFSELYDNQWTDLIEELRNEGSKRIKDEDDMEKECVGFLLNLLIKIFQWCEKTAKHQLLEIIKTFIPTATEETKQTWDQDITKRCKDFLKTKMSTENSLELITEQINNEVISGEQNLFKDTTSGTHFRNYWRTCTELCWFMNIQDPPVAMIYEYKWDAHIDNKDKSKDLFRAYTSNGPSIVFVVWPTLQLYKGGPMLYKGVAQYGTNPVTETEI